MRSHCYEMKFTRDAAGSYYESRNAGASHTSAAIDISGSSPQLLLSRGEIPWPATGPWPMHMRVSGTVTGNVSTGSVDTFRGSDDWLVNGTLEPNGTQSIGRCGRTGYFGAGRLGGGDFVRFNSDAQDAIEALGTGLRANVDGMLTTGEGPDTSPLAGPGIYDANVKGLWSGHYGFTDFCEDEDEEDYFDRLYERIIGHNGRHYTLPNGEIVKDCVFAGVCPTATVYISSSDYGNSGLNGIPSDVTQNTADRFRNHPAVFLRRNGAAYLQQLVERLRDSEDLVTEEVYQPIGIYQQVGNLQRSRWLMVFDGVPEVVYIDSGLAFASKRPKDIWNNLIVPLCQTKQANTRRVTVTDSAGGSIGTMSRFKYLEFARYLGNRGSTQQDNTVAPG